jgi:dienelactone hydrolase
MELDRSSTLVAATAAVAVVHLVDDNLVQPGLGHAGDHLWSTLLPAALIAGLVWAVRRFGPASRALAVTGLGVAAMTLATEAAYHLATGTLAADDWTGLACGALGLATTVVGGRDLWRSRRAGGPPWRRRARRTAKAVAAFVLAVQVGYPVVEAYVLSNAARRTQPAADLGVPFEEVTFPGADGRSLRGRYVPSRNGAAVMVVPGIAGGSRHARLLVARGYGVLQFDLGGVGRSEGEPNGWGWGKHEDVLAALRHLQQRPDVDPSRIGGLGLSVGGEVLLHAAAVDPGLRAVVSEGAGARSWREYRRLDGAAPWLWGPLAFNRTLATAVFTNRMPPADLHALVPRIEAPVLFIRAERAMGGEQLTDGYFERAGGPKSLWVTDSGHVGAIDADPAGYEARVLGFFDAALGRPATDEAAR